MPKPYIEDFARQKPGKCVISGSADGPVINTNRDFDAGPRGGTIYVSVASIAHLLRDLGWRDPDDAEALKSGHDAAQQRLKDQTEELEKLRTLKDAVQDLVEPEVREVQVVRNPTAEEIDAWAREHPDALPTVEEAARKPEPGSTEEWFALYGPKGPQTHAQEQQSESQERRKQRKAAKGVERSDDTPAEDPNEPPQIVQLHGQEVDLDEVLDGTVKEVTAFIEGHPLAFQQAVRDREEWRASTADKSARVTITDAVDEAEAEAENGDEDE